MVHIVIANHIVLLHCTGITKLIICVNHICSYSIPVEDAVTCVAVMKIDTHAPILKD